MNYRTVEVDLVNGRVVPRETETLPNRSRALLVLIDSPVPAPAMTCGELAERWRLLERLPAGEADAFADDIENSRTNLPVVRSAWD